MKKRLLLAGLVLLGASLVPAQVPTTNSYWKGPRRSSPVMTNSGSLAPSFPSDVFEYWPMEEGGGTRTGIIRGGQLTVSSGAVPSAAGIKNNGASVSVGNVLRSNTFMFPNPYGPFTHSFWIKPTSFTKTIGNPCPIFTSNAVTSGYDLVQAETSTSLTLFIYPQSASTVSILGDALSTGTWHLVIIWQDYQGAGGIRIDNGPIYTTTPTSHPFSNISFNQFSFSALTGVNGVVDEFAVFGYPLNADQQSFIWNGGSGHFKGDSAWP